MKSFSFFITVIIFFFTSCKKEYVFDFQTDPNYNTHVFGIIEDSKDSAKIYLRDFYFDNGFRDSTYIIDNQFKFELNLPEPRIFQIDASRKKENQFNGRHLMLQKGTTHITADDYDEFNEFNVLKSGIVTQQYLEYFNKFKYNRNLKFIEENSDNFVSLHMLWEKRKDVSISKLKKLYTNISDSLKDNIYAQNIETQIKLAKNGANDSIFPLNLIKDRKMDSLMTLNNPKYKLVEFTASWCTPCIKEIPFQKKAYLEFKRENLEIVHLFLEDPKKMKIYINKHKIPWKVVHIENGFQSDICEVLRINSIPSLYLLDQENNIIVGKGEYSLIRGENLTKTLRSKLKTD